MTNRPVAWLLPGASWDREDYSPYGPHTGVILAADGALVVVNARCCKPWPGT